MTRTSKKSIETYLIENHVVSLQRIANDRNGNARYEATVIDLEELQNSFSGWQEPAVFTFQHCCGVKSAAAWAVKYTKEYINKKN